MPHVMKIRMQRQQWIKMEKDWDYPSVAVGESQKQEGGHKRDTKNGNTVHFTSLMDSCHLKNANMGPQFQKYKGRVVLRGDIVKDDSRANAVFEQSSSASQMTAAKVMDVIARLPDCDGQAADAISADTQVKLEDAPRSLKIRKSACPEIWIRLPRHKLTKSKEILLTPLFLLRETFTETHLLTYCERGNSKKYCWNLDGKKYQIGNVCLFKENSKKLSVFLVVFFLMAGKKLNMAPKWQKLMKNVDLPEANIISWSRVFRVYSTWMQTKWNCY